MQLTRLVTWLITCIVLGGVSVAGWSQTENKPIYSDAEILLWMSDQLTNISRPMKLQYRYKRSGVLAEEFSDSVELDITHVYANGERNAELQFWSGARGQPRRSLEHIRGNPVLSAYLEADVYQLQRQTQGNWRYFQRAIKKAFAEAARIEILELDYQKRVVSGKRVTITPFLEVSHRSVLNQFAAKVYEFTLSESIPGGLYQIRAVVPAPNVADSDRFLLEDVLTFVQAGVL